MWLGGTRKAIRHRLPHLQDALTRISMLTQAYLKSILYYDPETGIFTWVRSGRTGWNGKEAGSVFSTKRSRARYRRVRILGVNYLLHRLALLYMDGFMPDRVDHKDEDGLNNRYLNLRSCTRSQNACNVKTKANNSSGKKNVYYRPDLLNPWRVSFNVSGKLLHIGNFPTIELAAEAARSKRIELHGDFANHT